MPYLKSIARKKLEGKLVGGNFSDLANYSDLFESMHDCVLLLDLGPFEVLQCNPACEKTLGVSSADLVGQDLGSFFDEFTQKRLNTFLAEASRGSIDLRWTSTMTEVTLELSVTRLELADYCSVLQLIARDVTAIRAQQKALESASTTDELTGISNRRAFNQELDRVHAESLKSSQPYAVLLMDVDNFKLFNDKNGHAAGDVALKEIGKILKAYNKPGIFPARYGGEEFVVVAHPAQLDKVKALAEDIRLTVQKSQVPHAEKQPLGFLSVSVGVAFWESGQTSAAVCKRADDGLYVCKEKGRNQVCLVDSATQTQPPKKK